MISGDQIVEIERVVPRTLDEINAIATRTGEQPMSVESYEAALNNYDPNMFDSALEIQNGEGGTWIAPTENAPEGATPGQRYPIHIDGPTLNRYVILRASPEIRFQIEANRATSHQTIDELTGGRTVEGPTDGDEDVDDDEINRER